MNVALVGFDTEGAASYAYYAARGDSITICDRNIATTVPEGVNSQLGDGYLNNLDDFDIIVRTPGINPAIILESNPTVAAKITSGTNIFFEESASRNIIGVTGTKGKGTTSTLITKMLEAAGQKVWLGGNIGVPALSFLNEVQPEDYVVLELSSFQLCDVRYSPPIGVCLMIVPEHLNWHRDMADYIDAKTNLFRHQSAEDTAIYFADNVESRQIASASQGSLLPYFEAPGAIVDGTSIVIDGVTICDVNDLKLRGAHNWQNACAAVTAAWQVTQDVNAMRTVLTTFSGLPHRLEFVREFEGVAYYDDSFGTTPETAIVALQAFAAPKVAILGGSDKGVTFDELAKAVASTNVLAAVVIGQTGPTIRQALEAVGFTNIIEGGNDITSVVAAAQHAAQPGSVVLLSTGCASFGMFDNYKQRGELFSAAVRALG